MFISIVSLLRTVITLPLSTGGEGMCTESTGSAAAALSSGRLSPVTNPSVQRPFDQSPVWIGLPP